MFFNPYVEVPAGLPYIANITVSTSKVYILYIVLFYLVFFSFDIYIYLFLYIFFIYIYLL